jgi:DNA-binding Lrp family transcriptional regulator
MLPEVMAFYRMAGEYDYLLRIQVADMKSYDAFYKRTLFSISCLYGATGKAVVYLISSMAKLEVTSIRPGYRMAGEYDYLLRIQVADMKSYDAFYKRLVNGVPVIAQRCSQSHAFMGRQVRPWCI